MRRLACFLAGALALAQGPRSLAVPCGPELGTSFAIVFESADPAPPTEPALRERMARFIAGDLLPFLRQNYPAQAGRIELNEMFWTNTVILTFPDGARAALVDFTELEAKLPQTVDRIRVTRKH